MRIDPTGVTRSTPARKTKRAGPTPSAFAEHLSPKDSSGQPVAVSQPGALDGLLALQQHDERAPGNMASAGLQRGADLLRDLEDIRVGLLLGRLDRATLENLTRKLENNRDRPADPRLAAILSEIELRAAVELAKLVRGTPGEKIK
ncbi:MAG: flagellar assembly protein FliX [Alphaproteobacteria bacterium]